ncbi:MAG: ferredoxin--NADP(+) reductase [Legionellales bacterium]|nr:ferredoxin--NADP(+) reductase [Legionellales bacterium]|tara:strand:- start:112498 stop:113229 length:732 start_codon:yes stop_codon:yes gene_type:complete
MAIQTFPMTIAWQKTIAPGVKQIALTKTDGSPLDFIPGQFITLHFPSDDKPIRRSYSIATIPGTSDTIEFAISYLKGGVASEILFNIDDGAELEVSGPYGRLVLRDDDPKRYILVSTGTGVTPYRAMLPQIKHRLEQDENLQVVVLQGVRSREDAFFVEDFLALAETQPRFQFKLFYSRETLTDAAPHEYEGYVQNGFDRLNFTIDDDLVYLCGNPGMIDDAFAICLEFGFSSQQVRREKYIS